MNNAGYGGWNPALAERLLRVAGISGSNPAGDLFSLPRLDAFSEFRA